MLLKAYVEGSTHSKNNELNMVSKHKPTFCVKYKLVVLIVPLENIFHPKIYEAQLIGDAKKDRGA